jgi:putative transposase
MRDISLDEANTFRESELVDALFEGDLIFLGGSKTTDAQRKLAEAMVDDLNMLANDDPRKIEAKRRWAYVRAIINNKSRRLNASTLIPLIQRVYQEIQDPNNVPHWRTVFYRWFKPFLASGEDPRVLVPQFKQRGNTKRRFVDRRKAKGQKFSKLELQLAREVAGVVEEVIDEEYLNTQRLSVQEVWNRLDNRIAEMNQFRAPDDQLPIPHINSIYRIVNQLDEYEKDSARFGKRYADQKHRCNKLAARPIRPLERTEIDHTKLDLFVVDEETRMPLGRPTITTLLDKRTAEVLGTYVGFDPPSYLSVMQCLNHAIKPKTYLKTDFPSVKNEWEAYGIPELIVVDNGKEFHSKDFEDACLQLGIVVMFSPPYQPRYKAAIERFFGTQNMRLLHQQRGTTFSNIFERHDYDPRKNAVISFSAFMEMLHIWIVDIYHQSYHKGLRDIPAHVWRREIKSSPPALPRRIEDLRIILGHVERRSIGPSGVELFTLLYNCDELARLRRELHGRKDKFTVKYDPTDLSTVFVYDRKNDRYIAVPALDQEYTKGLSLWQHKVVMNFARRDVKGRLDKNGLREAKRAIQKIVEAEIAKGNKTRTYGKAARWMGIRQPDYRGHIDIPAQNGTSAKEQDGVGEKMLLLNPEARSFEGVSELKEMSPNGLQDDSKSQLTSGTITSSSEAKDRTKKKARSKKHKKRRKPTSVKSTSTNADSKCSSLSSEDDDLDMTGFNASFNLPKKGYRDDPQAS